jgi:hypothetical protein
MPIAEHFAEDNGESKVPYTHEDYSMLGSAYLDHDTGRISKEAGKHNYIWFYCHWSGYHFITNGEHYYQVNQRGDGSWYVALCEFRMVVQERDILRGMISKILEG